MKITKDIVVQDFLKYCKNPSNLKHIKDAVENQYIRDIWDANCEIGLIRISNRNKEPKITLFIAVEFAIENKILTNNSIEFNLTHSEYESLKKSFHNGFTINLEYYNRMRSTLEESDVKKNKTKWWSRFVDLFSKNKDKIQIEKPIQKEYCKKCFNTGLVDHENAEFRTVKYWCECKYPKDEIERKNRRFDFLNYRIFDDHSYHVVSQLESNGDDLVLPDIDSVFEPSIAILTRDFDIIYVEFYEKIRVNSKKELAWNFLFRSRLIDLPKNVQSNISKNVLNKKK